MSHNDSGSVNLRPAGLLICVLLILPSMRCGVSPVPVTGPTAGVTLPGPTDNQPPTIQILSPTQSLVVDQGSELRIEWIDEDIDTNALVSLELDPNLITAGDEIPLLTNCPEDADGQTTTVGICPFGGTAGTTDRFILDTTGIPTGRYAIVARINDEVNPVVTAIAGVGDETAVIEIVEAGLSPANSPPWVKVTKPTLNLGVGVGDQLVIEWEDTDDDNDARLYVLLDFDNDPTNDDFTDANNDPGLILLGERREDSDPQQVDDQGNVTATGETPPPFTVVDLDGDGEISELEELAPCLESNRLCVTVDINRIPIRSDGAPYFIRITASDGVNPPVHAYAAGSIRVLKFSTSGVIDLGQIGKTLTGAVFQGFNTRANAGSEFVRVGDYDGDGAADPLILARFGQPFSRGNVGQAYLLSGVPGVRLAGVTNLNTVGVSSQGVQFAAGFGVTARFFFSITPEDLQTDGLTSAAVMKDVDGDGLSEFIFGTPRVVGLYDNADVDPQDKAEAGDCFNATIGGRLDYSDELPWPISDDEPANDDLGAGEFFFGGFGFDFVPFESGYVTFVNSSALLPNQIGQVMDLPLVGQRDPGEDNAIGNDEGTVFPGSAAPLGARFRGSWYDQLTFPDPNTGLVLVPDNRFGETVAVLPDMTSSSIIPTKDGLEELLISVPRGGLFGLPNRPGKINMAFGAHFGVFGPNPVQSFPWVLPVGECGRSTMRPARRNIVGAQDGDEFGTSTTSAGDFNQDGSPDILTGAPAADRDGKTDSGILYIIFGSLSFGNIDLAVDNPPRVEIHADNGDELGRTHNLVDDLDGGSIDDIAFGIPLHDSNLATDSGMVGIMLGGQLITGENIFSLDQLATFELPGFIIEGGSAGDRFGTSVASAGDFNGDGLGDLVITAPGETRDVDGQFRRGVVYIVFGSGDVINQRFTSEDIGRKAEGKRLEGRVFVSPYEIGTLDEAAPVMARGIGDVDGDGFDDVMIGNPEADFVDPASPAQRRPDAGEVYLIYGNNL